MAFSGAGAGILGDPYQITTWAQFQEILTDMSAHYQVMNDIDANFTTIGTVSSYFTGVLDGGNYLISNLATSGLFTCSGALVKNINTTFANASGNACLFGIYNTALPNLNSTFENITVNHSVPSTGVLYIFGKATDCTITNVTAQSIYAYLTLNGSSITTTYNNVILKSDNSIYIGSITTQQDTYNDCKFVLTHPENEISAKINGSTFNNCLFYAKKYFNPIYTYTYKTNYFKCAFFRDYTAELTGTVGTNSITIGFNTTDAIFTQCYFGGKINISYTNFTVYNTRKHFPFMKDQNATYAPTMIDCHFGYDLNVTWDAIPSGVNHNILSIYKPAVRCFIDAQIGQFYLPTGIYSTPANGTDIFVNTDKLDNTVIKLANYSQLNTAQTKVQSNFTNFDFVNVWEMVDGVSSPKLRDVIYDPTPYLPALPGILIEAVSIDQINTESEKVTIAISRKIEDGEGVLKCYASNSLDGIEAVENLTELTVIDDTHYESIFLLGEGYFYVLVVYEDGEYRVTESESSYHFSLNQVEPIIIDIPTGDFIQMASPHQVTSTHGTLIYDNYLYGTARGTTVTIPYYGETIFKLNINDYSDVLYQTFYLNKTAQTNPLRYFDQVVFCAGYLWTLSKYILVRVDPVTLDYMMFSTQRLFSAQQPIATDGVYLYITSNTDVRKIDTNLLIGEFSSYGYDGSTTVNLPPNIDLAIYNIIQADPEHPVHMHSIIIDSDYVYLAFTSSAGTIGVSYYYHLLKLNKHTMLFSGVVQISKTTDDMTQNENYIFLAPEGNSVEVFGEQIGVLAIKKRTLQTKPLKALTAGTLLHTWSYGIQYFGDFMAVQNIDNKQTILIDTTNVDNWSLDLPIGAVTVAVYQFSFNGVAAVASNEISVANDGKIHANTWESNTTVYKYLMPDVEISFVPIVQSVLIKSLLETTTIGGFIIFTGSSEIIEIGLHYGTDRNNLSETIVFANPSDPFQSELNLTPGIYYFRAWAVNSVGTGYGSVVPFIVGNTVILSNENVNVAIDLKSVNSGLAVRCCRPAPGIANGTLGLVADIDGNEYETVVINEKEWFTKDLKVKKYNNGDVIPEVIDRAAWQALITGAWVSNLTP